MMTSLGAGTNTFALNESASFSCFKDAYARIFKKTRTAESAGREVAEKVSELEKELARIRSLCGHDEKCHQTEINKLFDGNVLTKFNSLRCLRGDSQAMKSTIRGLVIANAGMLWQTRSEMSKAKETGKNDDLIQHLPIAMLANTWLWTFFLNEIGCQNTLLKKLKDDAKPNEILGAAASVTPKKSSWAPWNWYTKEELRKMPSSYWNYFVWSPPNEATFYAFYYLQEKLRGHDIEFLDPKAMGSVIGMGILYDVTWAIPRQVLVMDSVYLRKFPALQVYADRLLKEKAVSEVIMLSGDAAIRSFVNKVNTQVNNQYMDWAKGFYEKPQGPTDSNSDKKEDDHSNDFIWKK